MDFSRLMSLDYQREWLQQRERKQQQQKEKLKVRGVITLYNLQWNHKGPDSLETI